MRIFWTILFYSSLLFFLLLIVFLITIEAYSLEFKNGDQGFENFKMTWIPIAFLASLSSLEIGKTKSDLRKNIQISITVFVALFVFIWIPFSSFLSCTTSYYDIYQNKKDPSIKIVKSIFGCGAVDSTAPTIDIVKIKEYPFGLIKETRVDTSKIDKSNWQLISKN